MKLFQFLAVFFAGDAMASRLIAASYAGTVASLSLSRSGENYELTTVSQTNECGASPAWLMLDGAHEILYCLDEGIGNPNATLTSFKLHTNGSFSKVKQLHTLAGPVASAFYTPAQRPDHKFFAIAH
jgi:hypothetical protein